MDCWNDFRSFIFHGKGDHWILYFPVFCSLQVLKKRPDLRVIVASATMDADELRRYFNLGGPRSPATAAILSLEGRSHPVRVYYSEEPVADYVKASVDTVMNIHKQTLSGDVLVRGHATIYG